jgi:hypothetical protein
MASSTTLETCWCYECLDDPSMGMSNPATQRMIVCPDCGNKRCPRSDSHNNACTGSNEPGQRGSRYEHDVASTSTKTPKRGGEQW